MTALMGEAHMSTGIITTVIITCMSSDGCSLRTSYSFCWGFKNTGKRRMSLSAMMYHFYQVVHKSP